MEDSAQSFAGPSVAWHQLSTSNVESLIRVADKLHPDLPESEQVFAERLKLFPEGCLALVDSESGELYGYAISHPIRRRQPPALDSLLGEIASDADQYYIHDLVTVPELRGSGFAREGIEELLATVAQRYSATSLVCVYGTAPFWGLFGFVPGTVGEKVEKKWLDYGDDAVYLERQNE